MSSAIFEAQTDAMRRIFARVTACEPSAFDEDGVRVTARPEPAPWPFTGMIVGFGAGLVVCVEQRYLEWAREHARTTPQRANYLAIPLAQEAARRGEELHPAPPMPGWALTREPPALEPPDGYRLQRVDKAWMDEWQPRERFTNALGHAVQAHRRFRNQFAYALFDGDGEPAAIAGVYDTAGLSEIGVDVTPAHRGRGLSPVVVAAACADVLAAGSTPFYECEVRNIRSQHTALASGFAPALTLSLVMQAGLGLE